MKHIFKKLHIGSNHDPARSKSSNEVTSTSATTSPSCASGQTSGNPPANPFSSSPAPPSNVSANGAATAESTTPGNRPDYMLSEEEFQVQLALAISASNSDCRDDPEKDQIRTATMLSLGGRGIDSTGDKVEEAAAETLSRHYWVLTNSKMVEEVFPSWTKKRKRDPLKWSTSWSSSKWSELQPELLELIIKRLSFVDMLRLKAVCSSWNSTAQSCVTLMMNRAPWLMLPSYQENDDLTRCFYSLKENKVYTIKNAFEDFRGAWCVGSSHGWLVILMDKKIPHLFNPIFGNKSIELPQIPSATSSLIGSNVPYYRVTKAVISSDPSRYNFSVAIIYGMRPSRLAFYNHGDEEWTDLNGEHQEYCDIIFHNDQLFALAENGSVEAWDFRKPSPKRSINLQPSAQEVDLGDYASDERFSTMTYLVESSGEILSVVRCIANYVNHEGKAIHEMDLPNEPCSPCPYRTLQFYVFKLNFAANKWENVESLGNRALFLGGSQSMSLSTGEVPGCEENSIYFTDDSWDAIEWSGHEHEEDAHGGHDMGVYNLEEKVVKQFYQVDKWRIDPPPFWIVPNPG